MIIYNITTKVDRRIGTGWLEWMKSEHIPAIIATGCFSHCTLLHLIEADDAEGYTYAAQFHTSDISGYERYVDEYAAHYSKIAIEKWGEKFISFRTVMRVVN